MQNNISYTKTANEKKNRFSSIHISWQLAVISKQNCCNNRMEYNSETKTKNRGEKMACSKSIYLCCLNWYEDAKLIVLFTELEFLLIWIYATAIYIPFLLLDFYCSSFELIYFNSFPNELTAGKIFINKWYNHSRCDCERNFYC